MKDMWTALEEHTRAWHALDRQGLADAVWADYVTARFSRTGDARALPFLYPYLNRGDSNVRLQAIEVAGRVFHTAGPKAVRDLDYFTRNLDPFLRDRAVQVIGAALAEWPAKVILEHLAPYLNHPNQFIRQQAVTALSRAAFGSGDEGVLLEIRRVADRSRLGERERHLAVARVFAGRPTDGAYGAVAVPDIEWSWRGTDLAVGILLRGASDEWYRRGCREFFEPRLNRKPKPGDPHRFCAQFTHRSAIEGLCRAAAGKGMDALERMLHLRGNACTARALIANAPACFAGAESQDHRGPLLELLRTGDVPAQRVAAVCLGSLLDGSEDEAAAAALKELCGARNRAVAAGAVRGLGMVARSTCDEELRALCLDLAGDPQTAAPAVEGLGMVFQGSGRSDILADIRERAEAYRHSRVPGKKHSRPLAACFYAAGLVYQGTGSMEPVDFLVDALALSRTRYCAYRWSAGRALVMIEFPATTIARTLDQPWI